MPQHPENQQLTDEKAPIGFADGSIRDLTLSVNLLDWLTLRTGAARSHDYVIIGDDVASAIRACPDATGAVHLRSAGQELWQLWPMKLWLASPEHKSELRKAPTSLLVEQLNKQLNLVRLKLRTKGVSDKVVSDIVNHICNPTRPEHHTARIKAGLGPDKFDWPSLNGSYKKLS